MATVWVIQLKEGGLYFKDVNSVREVLYTKNKLLAMRLDKLEAAINLASQLDRETYSKHLVIESTYYDWECNPHPEHTMD